MTNINDALLSKIAHAMDGPWNRSRFIDLLIELGLYKISDFQAGGIIRNYNFILEILQIHASLNFLREVNERKQFPKEILRELLEAGINLSKVDGVEETSEPQKPVISNGKIKEPEKADPAITVSINGNVTGNVVIGDRNTANQQSAQNNASKSKEVFFDAGGRLRQVREEIGVKSSEMIELLGLQSERQYLTMERQAEEVPFSLLELVHKLTGVSLEWLKHEENPRYEIEAIYFNPINRDLQYCDSLNPIEYFLTLEPKSLHTGLIVQTNKYCFQTIETGVNLNLWDWLEDHWAIPAFYKFLKALSDPWHDIDGIIINASDDKRLYDGSIHFSAVSRMKKTDLIYDILDINETRGVVARYSKTYGGNWMHKVHDTFKKYL
ncbi:MAG: hypothetical protein IPL71_05595 [Anaerolineales bacterium]|uniref:hypothetical protein n=1 Tax=Candidatus Villigracilis proximus TaxID=3140683 RepID=UPI003136E6F1|nr:hypothetical protein [Anaerolineales bacterium]